MNNTGLMGNLNSEIECLKRRIEELKAQNEELRTQLVEAKTCANRAKDFSPVGRASFRRVMMVVTRACMNLKRVAGGWLLFMGNLERKFKTLQEIWMLLTQEDWYLSDIFSPQKSSPQPKDIPRRRSRYRQIFDWQPWKHNNKPDDEPDDDIPFASSD